MTRYIRLNRQQARVLADGSAQAYMLTLLLAVAVGLIALQLIGG